MPELVESFCQTETLHRFIDNRKAEDITELDVVRTWGDITASEGQEAANDPEKWSSRAACLLVSPIEEHTRFNREMQVDGKLSRNPIPPSSVSDVSEISTYRISNIIYNPRNVVIAFHVRLLTVMQFLQVTNVYYYCYLFAL